MRFSAPLVAASALAFGLSPAIAEDLPVMTFNIWWGGVSSDAPLEQTAEVIRRAGAEIVGIQESYTWDERGEAFYRDNTAALAGMLGWDFVVQKTEQDGVWNDTAILSKHPIKSVTGKRMCAVIDVRGTEINFCNIHLQSAPYQPYQLTGIEYGEWPLIETAEAAIAYSELARGDGVPAMLAELATLDESRPTILTGDFNEPSHRDWTAATVEAGMTPVAVAYPQTAKVEAAGFADAFRVLRPDPVAAPGLTWTPLTAPDDPAGHHDRIDFIFLRNAEPASVAIVGEKAEAADIVVTPWPSDHRAVTATIRY